jgi:hypothetical protein
VGHDCEHWGPASLFRLRAVERLARIQLRALWYGGAGLLGCPRCRKCLPLLPLPPDTDAA